MTDTDIDVPRTYRIADGSEIEVYKREVLERVEHL